MRRIALISLVAVSLAACSNETTSPASDPVDEFATGAFGTELTSVGGYDADLYQGRLFNALPDSIKLTDEQKTKIAALIEAFKQATKLTVTH